MDIRLNNEYCTVTDKKGKVILAQFFEKVRMETLQTVNHSAKIADIDKRFVLAVPEDGIVEKNMIYNYNDKVICPIETKDVKEVKLRIDAKIIKG